MMTDHSHGNNQVDAAFAVAPQILRELVDSGLENPSFHLFPDGSGSLDLGIEKSVSREQVEKAIKLIHSNRFRHCYKCLLGKQDKNSHPHSVIIDFCDGLIEEARIRDKKS